MLIVHKSQLFLTIHCYSSTNIVLIKIQLADFTHLINFCIRFIIIGPS